MSPLLVMLLTLAVSSYADEFPTFITVCRRSNPNYDACVKQSINDAGSRLADGFPSLNLDGFDPINIPTVNTEYYATNINVNAVLKNVKVTGMRDFNVNSLRTSTDHRTWQIIFTVPELLVSCDSEFIGDLQSNSVNGIGSMSTVFDNVIFNMTGVCTLTQRSQQQYLQVSSIESNIKITDATFSFSGPNLLPSTTDFFNKNTEDVLLSIKPILDAAASQYIIKAVNPVLMQVPYDKLLPA